MKRYDLKTIVFISLLVALSVAFKYFSPTTQHMRFSLFAIPLLMVGIISGPYWGGLAGLTADLTYSIFSGYAYNPFFTISMTLIGIAGGFIRRKGKNLNMVNLILVVVISSILETSINTVGQLIYYGWGELVKLPWRLLAMVIRWPIIVLAIRALDERVIQIYFEHHFQKAGNKFTKPNTIMINDKKQAERGY